MAETFLSRVIEKLLELGIEEAKLLKGVRRELKSLKDELEIIHPFLRDAEVRSENGQASDATKAWLKQMREQADRIDDVVDEYIYHVEQHHQQGRFIGSLHINACHCIKSLKPRHDIASEIQDIQRTLREIKERGVSYGLRPLEQGSSSITTDVERHDPRLRSLFMEEDEIIGVDGAAEEFMNRLMEGVSMRSVTSLVGQGGIGKTTLARKVYNNEVVKGYFDCHAWITVSQSYDVKMLLRIIMRHVCGAGERIEEDCTMDELITLLRKHLQTKRYMIVFDDVWQKEFWEVMKFALPDNNKGSRIIITTRNSAVATFCADSCYDLVKELRTWSSEMAWQLFCKKAFRNGDIEGCCTKELEQLSHAIVSKCQGLPLLISTIAGLLSTKERVDFEWRKVLNDLNLEYERTDVPKILSLGYHDLPYHLKLCFLYFGIFPEDYVIHEWKLYRLWIAEGFVKESKNKTLEEVAQEYLEELIQRSLVLFEVEYGVKRQCKVHDLMHDIILARAGELRFCRTLNKSKSSLRAESHRLSIHHTTKNVLERVRGSKIRSVFLFNIDDYTKLFIISLSKDFKLLKVLDFEDAPLDHLPEEVGNLFHLKYLCLRGTNVKVLPKSLGKLKNLQTLDVSNTLVQELPVQVNKLRNLRHLLSKSFDQKIQYSFDAFCGVRIGEGIGRLEELQTLTGVKAFLGRTCFLKEIQKLRKLRRLEIANITAEMGKDLGTCFEKLNNLELLSLTSINEDEVLDLKHISSPPPLLRYLELNCQLQQFPMWISKLYNLQGLLLNFSRLRDLPLKCLEGLPNLAYLDMYKTYDGEELHFEEGGFQKLKQLKLYKLDGLRAAKIDRGALPLLEKLDFGPCPLMKEMPSDIQNLTNLKCLEIYDMPREFVLGVQPESGVHYRKIQHVPFVTFHYYKHKGWNFDKYRLGSLNLLQLLQEQAG